MQQIWAPWRMRYIQMEKPKGCILCEKAAQNNDAANYVLYRGDKNFVIMNTYPYNPGHLLIAPCRHAANLDDLTPEELHEHIEIVSRGVKILRQTFSPAGFNLGTNMGKVAGAGIADHVHTHIVPRWQGDVNFMPVIGQTKVISQSLITLYNELKNADKKRN